MSNFVLTKQHLREVLIFCFNWKKSAPEVYGDTAPTDKSCGEWFRRFKDGYFSVEDKPRSGQPKKFEDKELEALLEEDQSQTQEEFAESLGVTQQIVSARLRVMGIIQKQGNWVPYELKPRDVERRFFTCEQLIQRQQRKGFLHRIVTGDEKWIFYDNPKQKKYYAKPIAINRRHRPQHQHKEEQSNIHSSKIMFCIW
ncbi:Mariner Mos1 transposase [Acromyrmex echinatior]|uniref:Mariner Mos1 transposase n=1 Tax=Acromyrmex echinatior TaxID=103372 RepID=F4WEZ4_ACREC|nr:Mariner Mos1 transposase [Acromyrmex echinatior]